MRFSDNPLKPPAFVLMIVCLLLGVVLGHELGLQLCLWGANQLTISGLQLTLILVSPGLLICWAGSSVDWVESVWLDLCVGDSPNYLTLILTSLPLAPLGGVTGGQFRPPRFLS